MIEYIIEAITFYNNPMWYIVKNYILRKKTFSKLLEYKRRYSSTVLKSKLIDYV